MKVFIIALALVLLCTGFAVFQQDSNFHELQLYKVKFVAEEAAAAAAQYYIPEQYSKGIFQFNQMQGMKAAAYVIRKNLKLDTDFLPIQDNYWVSKVNYTIEFFDDSNTTYPMLYEDHQSMFSTIVTSPTVIVSINCGKARYRIPFINFIPDSRRISAHEWKAY